MYRILIIFVFSFLINKTYCQEKKIDSLEQVLNSTTKDSIKVEVLEKLQLFYRKKEITTHKNYILKGLELSKKNNWIQKSGIFTREMGIYYKNRDLLDSSIIYYENAKQLFERDKDSANYYAVNSSIANIKKKQGKYQEAVSYFINCITYYESKSDKKSQLNVQIIKLNLANVYVNLNDNEKAISNYLAIIKNPISKTNKALQNAAFTNLSGCYKNIHQLDSALYYANQSETLLKGSKQYRSLANLYTNIGAIYEEKEENTNAKNYFLKALKAYERIKNTSGIIKSYNNLGNINIKSRDFISAKNYLTKSQNLLKSTKNINSLSHNYQMLISLYQKTGSYKNAFDTQLLLTKLNDSILGLENKKAIQEIETKYQVAKKTLALKNANEEHAIAMIKAENNKTYLLYTTIGGLLILIIFVLYFLLYKRKKNQELINLELKQTQKELVLEKQYHDSELKALKAQMNPHFMFNAMNSIQSLILKGDKEEAYSYLTKFSTLIRDNLNMSEKNFIYFDQEINLLTTYLQLEHLRFKTNFEYHIHGENDIDDIKIPSMIIQPFIENAIKHGLLHKQGLKKLTISFKQSDVLVCIVEDNGIGREASEKINKSQLNKPNSFSTGAINKRFDLLKEYYNLNLGFKYTDLLDENEKPTGTKVTIKIPYILDDE